MKKNTGLLFLSSLLISTTVVAETLSNQAQRIAEQISAIEQDIEYRDAREVGANLDRIEYVLRYYGSPDEGGAKDNLICVSNGSSGSFEKFTPTDSRTNQKLGGETTMKTCQTALKESKNSILCLSNGSSGTFEKFTPYSLKIQKMLGGDTNFSTCIDLIKKSTRKFICTSNGSSGSFEKFTLYNLSTEQAIGSGTSYANCTSSIPK